ncbi:MAG: hypothetical protein ACOYVG_03710 [Bacteroidota bacterium]
MSKTVEFNSGIKLLESFGTFQKFNSRAYFTHKKAPQFVRLREPRGTKLEPLFKRFEAAK